MTLKTDAEVKKQRITKIPKHYRDGIQNKKFGERGNKKFIEWIGLDAAEKYEIDSKIIIPTLILQCGDTCKSVIYTRQFNATTDISKHPLPLLTVQVPIPRKSGTILSTTDLCTAYHLVTLAPEFQ